MVRPGLKRLVQAQRVKVQLNLAGTLASIRFLPHLLL